MTFLQVVRFWIYTFIMAVTIFGFATLLAFTIAKFMPETIDDIPAAPFMALEQKELQ